MCFDDFDGYDDQDRFERDDDYNVFEERQLDLDRQGGEFRDTSDDAEEEWQDDCRAADEERYDREERSYSDIFRDGMDE